MCKEYRLKDIPVHQFLIDDSYQRTAQQRWVTTIDKNWDWNKFKPIIVTPRKNDRFAVIDGQHTVKAAIQHDIAVLPSRVMEAMSLVKEAQLFYHHHFAALRARMMEGFKAKLVAEDPEAIGIMSILSTYKLKMALSRLEYGEACVRCVTAVQRIWRSDDGPAALTKVVQFITSTWHSPHKKAEQDKDRLHSQVFLALSFIVHHAKWKGINYDKLSKMVAARSIGGYWIPTALSALPNMRMKLPISTSTASALAYVWVGEYNNLKNIKKLWVPDVSIPSVAVARNVQN